MPCRGSAIAGVISNLVTRTPVDDPDWLNRVKMALRSLAQCEEVMVRPHAVWALYRLFGERASKILDESRRSEYDEATLEEYSWWEEKRALTS